MGGAAARGPRGRGRGAGREERSWGSVPAGARKGVRFAGGGTGRAALEVWTWTPGQLGILSSLGGPGGSSILLLEYGNSENSFQDADGFGGLL